MMVDSHLVEELTSDQQTLVHQMCEIFDSLDSKIILGILELRNWNREDTVEDLLFISDQCCSNATKLETELEETSLCMPSTSKQQISEFLKKSVENLSGDSSICEDLSVSSGDTENPSLTSNIRKDKVFDYTSVNRKNHRIERNMRESCYDECSSSNTDSDFIVEDIKECNTRASVSGSPLDKKTESPNDSSTPIQNLDSVSDVYQIQNTSLIFPTVNSTYGFPSNSPLNYVSYERMKRTQDAIERVKLFVKEKFKVMVLMRGCPGSGKSYLAKHIVSTCCPNQNYYYYTYSADDYFNYVNKGKYVYNIDQLSDAHVWARQNVANAVKDNLTPIIIDNTNTKMWEMRHFAIMAVNAGYYIEIIEPSTTWMFNAKALRKRNTHGVLKDKLKIMLDRYEHNITPLVLLRSLGINYRPSNAPPQFGKTVPTCRKVISYATELLYLMSPDKENVKQEKNIQGQERKKLRKRRKDLKVAERSDLTIKDAVESFFSENVKDSASTKHVQDNHAMDLSIPFVPYFDFSNLNTDTKSETKQMEETLDYSNDNYWKDEKSDVSDTFHTDEKVEDKYLLDGDDVCSDELDTESLNLVSETLNHTDDSKCINSDRDDSKCVNNDVDDSECINKDADDSKFINKDVDDSKCINKDADDLINFDSEVSDTENCVPVVKLYNENRTDINSEKIDTVQMSEINSGVRSDKQINLDSKAKSLFWEYENNLLKDDPVEYVKNNIKDSAEESSNIRSFLHTSVTNNWTRSVDNDLWSGNIDCTKNVDSSTLSRSKIRSLAEDICSKVSRSDDGNKINRNFNSKNNAFHKNDVSINEFELSLSPNPNADSSYSQISAATKYGQCNIYDKKETSKPKNDINSFINIPKTSLHLENDQCVSQSDNKNKTFYNSKNNRNTSLTQAKFEQMLEEYNKLGDDLEKRGSLIEVFSSKQNCNKASKLPEGLFIDDKYSQKYSDMCAIKNNLSDEQIRRNEQSAPVLVLRPKSNDTKDHMKEKIITKTSNIDTQTDRNKDKIITKTSNIDIQSDHNNEKIITKTNNIDIQSYHFGKEKNTNCDSANLKLSENELQKWSSSNADLDSKISQIKPVSDYSLVNNFSKSWDKSTLCSVNCASDNSRETSASGSENNIFGSEFDFSSFGKSRLPYNEHVCSDKNVLVDDGLRAVVSNNAVQRNCLLYNEKRDITDVEPKKLLKDDSTESYRPYELFSGGVDNSLLTSVPVESCYSLGLQPKRTRQEMACNEDSSVRQQKDADDCCGVDNSILTSVPVVSCYSLGLQPKRTRQEMALCNEVSSVNQQKDTDDCWKYVVHDEDSIWLSPGDSCLSDGGNINKIWKCDVVNDISQNDSKFDPKPRRNQSNDLCTTVDENEIEPVKSFEWNSTDRGDLDWKKQDSKSIPDLETLCSSLAYDDKDSPKVSRSMENMGMVCDISSEQTRTDTGTSCISNIDKSCSTCDVGTNTYYKHTLPFCYLTCPDDYTIITAYCREINNFNDSNGRTNELVLRRYKLNKSTMTDLNRRVLKERPTMEQLQKVFTPMIAELLYDLFYKCSGDVDWIASLLCEYGYPIAADEFNLFVSLQDMEPQVEACEKADDSNDLRNNISLNKKSRRNNKSRATLKRSRGSKKQKFNVIENDVAADQNDDISNQCISNNKSTSIQDDVDNKKIDIFLDASVVSQLVNHFGNPTVLNLNDYQPIVQIPESLGRQLHAHLVESVIVQAEEHEAVINQFIAEDEQATSLFLQNQSKDESEKAVDMSEVIEMEKSLYDVRQDEHMTMEETELFKVSLQSLMDSFPNVSPEVISNMFKVLNYDYKVTITSHDNWGLVRQLIYISVCYIDQFTKETLNSLRDHADEISNEVSDKMSNEVTIEQVKNQRNYLLQQAKEESSRDDSINEDTFASKLSLNSLFKSFPRMNQAVITNMFKMHNYSYHDTLMSLNEHTASYPDDVQKQVDAENTHDTNIFNTEELSRTDAKMEVDFYRNEAAHYYQQYEACVDKVKSAIQKKNYTVASYYSDLSRVHKKRYEKSNEEAATALVSTCQKGGSKVIDLHFFKVKEALQALDLFLDYHISKLAAKKKSNKKTTLFIITGRGKRSANGMSHLKKPVTSRLRKRQIEVIEDVGMVMAVIRKNSRLTTEL